MSLTTSATAIIRTAMTLDGLISAGESVNAGDQDVCFGMLQTYIDALNTQTLTVLVVQRSVFTLTANQQTYTIGPAALTPDFSTGTAARPVRLEGAGLVLGYTTPETELPLFMLTDDLYEAIGIKAQTSTQPTQIYYNPTDPLGTVFLWPNPTVATNDLALYTGLLTPQFTALTTSYICPPGYKLMIEFNLAQLMCPLFGVQVPGEVARVAKWSQTMVKNQNVKPSDLSVDAALMPQMPGGSYNVLTDQGA